MTLGSLFDGISGFPLAASWCGIETKWISEINPYCIQVSKKNFPNAKQHGNIKYIGIQNLEQVDIIAGGFPCKQTSVSAAIHGKRNGLSGVDSGLWTEQLRVYKELLPAWAIVENVAGVQEWEDTIQDGLEGIGYAVSKLEYKACDFGLPHKRKRCFYVGNTNGKRLEIARLTESPEITWVQRLTLAGGDWLQCSPGDGRGINGLPNRMDRIEALGNSVVPFMAYQIFKSIQQFKEL